MRNLLALIVVLAAGAKGAFILQDMGLHFRRNDQRALAITPEMSAVRDFAHGQGELTLITTLEGQERVKLGFALQYEITPIIVNCVGRFELREAATCIAEGRTLVIDEESGELEEKILQILEAHGLRSRVVFRRGRFTVLVAEEGS